YGHRYIVDHAEPFAMIREGVMKSAADVDRRDILQRMLRRQNRATRSQPECINQFGRIRNLHLQFFNSGESPRLKFVYVIWFVYEEYVLIRRGLRSDEIRRVSYAKFNQLIVHAAILLSRKDVLPDGQIVFVTINELEREHEQPIILKPPSSRTCSLFESKRYARRMFSRTTQG